VTAWAGLTIPKMYLHYREKLNILYAGTSIFNGVHNAGNICILRLKGFTVFKFIVIFEMNLKNFWISKPN
jgi:hypothetical protein